MTQASAIFILMASVSTILFLLILRLVPTQSAHPERILPKRGDNAVYLDVDDLLIGMPLCLSVYMVRNGDISPEQQWHTYYDDEGEAGLYFDARNLILYYRDLQRYIYYSYEVTNQILNFQVGAEADVLYDVFINDLGEFRRVN